MIGTGRTAERMLVILGFLIGYPAAGAGHRPQHSIDENSGYQPAGILYQDTGAASIAHDYSE